MGALEPVHKVFNDSAKFLANKTLNLFYKPAFWVSLGAITVSLVILSWLMPKQFSWTGFGEDSTTSKSIEKTVEGGKITSKGIEGGKVTSVKEIDIDNFQSGKTLWEWLELAGVLAIPVVLFQFQRQEQKQADTNLREEALRDYIDKMAELLLDKGLSVSTNPDAPVLDVARARTLSILRRLDGDGDRKGSVVRFLIEAELIKGFMLLSHADLKNAELNFTNLSEANLAETNLCQANLRRANLNSTNLYRANLYRANLHNADLTNANLHRANLTGAILEGAILKGAKNLTLEQIKAAKSWEQATYDPDFHEKLGLPPKPPQIGTNSNGNH